MMPRWLTFSLARVAQNFVSIWLTFSLTFTIDLSIFLVSIHFPPYGVFFSRKYRTGKCMLFNGHKGWEELVPHTF